MTEYEYETQLRQCWIVPGDEGLCDLSIRECLALELEQILFEMAHPGPAHPHWVQRLKDYRHYVA